MERIVQEIKTGAATEANLQQQTANLREMIPQIQATVDQLKAATKLAGAHTTLAAGQTAQAYAATGLAKSQTSETDQRIKQNLPALEAALMNLDRVRKQMEVPAQQREEAFADSPTGVITHAIERVVKALNPFSGIIANVPNTPPPAPPGRKDWKK